MFGELRVVTPARWLPADLAAGAPAGVRVVHDLGLDVDPATGPDVAWWCPGVHGARLVAAGVPVAFTAPGPHFTARLPHTMTGRRLWTGTLDELELAPAWTRGPVHAKAAEVKVGALPAAVHPDLATFARVSGEHLAPGTVVQVSEPIALGTEYRCFVVAVEVVACAAYLAGGRTWDAWSAADAPPVGPARAYGAYVARNIPGPPAYVLDVAQARHGRWLVVEANPAWSSNPYHYPPGPVVDAILTAQQPDERWTWQIDPHLVRAATYRPLPLTSRPTQGAVL